MILLGSSKGLAGSSGGVALKGLGVSWERRRAYGAAVPRRGGKEGEEEAEGAVGEAVAGVGSVVGTSDGGEEGVVGEVAAGDGVAAVGAGFEAAG